MSQRRTSPGWLDFLLPASCLACGSVAGGLGLGLCAACLQRLREAPQPACNVCGRAVSGGQRCGRCLDRDVGYRRLLAGWLYTAPCDRVLTALKFSGLEYLGADLAGRLARRFRGDLAPCDLVVAIPLHWSRRLRRGYNQAERLASPLARELGLPLVPALRRRRRTRPQTSLGRGERLAALTGAFVPGLQAARLSGAEVILVDDVATTGATLAAAAATLLAAGARGVTALVAARVPGGGEVV